MNTLKPSPSHGGLRWLALIGPGLIVAATGVGAGDLWTGGFAGGELGVAVLWAVIVGAFLKFVLTEGLARWQLATGQTILEGALLRLGRPIQYLFLFYLLGWSVFVGSALVSACGKTVSVLFPILQAGDRIDRNMVLYGVIHSVIGVILVRSGGYRLLIKLMGVLIAIMFVTVLMTAVIVGPDWLAVARGMIYPTIPRLGQGGMTWVVALMGGVGGTLTVICYGYWIREENRSGGDDLLTCRIDLGVGYAMTALFGLAMVIIGSEVDTAGLKGTSLLVGAADRMAQQFGEWARWMFLAGAWAAVFSSLLGVWQAVPYVFADYCNIIRRLRQRDADVRAAVDTQAPAYRFYLIMLAVVSMFGLVFDFRQVQKYYAVVGALFMPMLALALLILNGRSDWVGARFCNRPWTIMVLVATLIFFVCVVSIKVYAMF